ncbi:prolyl oligopeptidase family protein [Humitalea rosea]|uniref:Prolyl oligopeptidase family protein n=1 Tax=Humitalea rosea TaxID=990373 RepID=A0A2W7I4U5_9PROT|nr:alpha/beta fold hydrolase [Humitalea rosea]PZW41896.1 prolyl oligopeptidase family protein [Humitalea rosea]
MASTGIPSWTDHFPGNFLWSNAMLVCKGMAPYGAVALRDIDRIGARLAARQGETAAWAEEWFAEATSLEAAAAAASAETAGLLLLRAGMYRFTGERFVPPGAEKRQMGEAAYRSLHAGLRARHKEIEFVEVPYAGTTLPALFMKAPGVPASAPVVVVFDGMDNCKEMSVLFAGLEFARRGMHTLAIDGPGQGETLRMRGISARHDYEVAGAAAFDYLTTRKDVDAGRIVVMGYSFGGYYAVRVAAHEPRFAAGVALTAPHWDLAGFQRGVRDKARAAGQTIAQSNFQFRWVVGAADDDAAIAIAETFDVAGAAARVACPFLVTHGAEDRVIPVANADRLFSALATPNKTLKIFTAEEGGAQHAHVDDRQIGISHAADWITEILRTTAG